MSRALGQKSGVVAKHRELVLDAIQSGMRLSDVATLLGLKTHGAISNALRDDPEYLTAREVGVESRMELRERELEAAEDSVSVARARELLSHSRWRAEREFPDRWGQRNQLKVEHVGDLGERLRRAQQRVRDARTIDGEVLRDSPAIAPPDASSGTDGDGA